MYQVSDGRLFCSQQLPFAMQILPLLIDKQRRARDGLFLCEGETADGKRLFVKAADERLDEDSS